MRSSLVLSIFVVVAVGALAPSGLSAPSGSGATGSAVASGGAAASAGAVVQNQRAGSTGAVPPAQPIVYRQVGYLATTGPAPMRFTAMSPGGNERTPPRISANKRPELSKTAEGMARTEAIEAYRSIFGRMIPVPSGSPEPGSVPPAFMDPAGVSGSNPNEVLEFFQQPAPEADAQKRQNRFLFDPVFQAAQPPVQGTPPQSRATYQKN